MDRADGASLDRRQPAGRAVTFSLVVPLRMLGARRELIGELVRHELRNRHAGQMLGVAWAYGHPLILMLIYTMLFAYVFPARFGAGAAVTDYSVNIFAGLVSWLAFQDVLARSPSVMIDHASLVKQIVFPTEVLPIQAALASAVSYSIGVVFVIGYAALHGRLSWMILLLPLVIAFQLAAMIGMTFLLSAAGVFFRDLRDIVGVLCTINLFAQPILYNPVSLPHALRWVFIFNPFSYLVWCWQDTVFYGAFQHAAAWVVLPVGSVATLIAGWFVFGRVRHQFGDAL
jgi:lipopolysaccharide transport system permease protein